MSRRTLAVLAAVVGFAVAATVAVVLITSNGSKSQKPAIILVHGYGGTVGCPGGDVRSYWSGLTQALIASGSTNAVVPVSYYQCDRNGTSIDGAAKASDYFGSGDQTIAGATVGYSENTDIRHLGYVLAWYVYDTYSRNGQQVDLVGHSMGGLMIRWAMQRVAAHDGAFPPYLKVANVVTISTPYDGAIPAVQTLASCKGSAECAQFAAGSAFLAALAAGPAPTGTDWTALGGGPCDLMSPASATDVRPAHKLTWTQPCYDHSKILYDDSQTLDATVIFSNPGDTSPTTIQSGPHSLAAVVRALQSTSW